MRFLLFVYKPLSFMQMVLFIWKGSVLMQVLHFIGCPVTPMYDHACRLAT